MYLLDTNILSYLMRGHPGVRASFETVRRSADAAFVLSPVVDYEIRRYLLLKGATRNLAQYQSLTALWLTPAFDDAHWEHAIRLWAERHRIGKPIADADLLIAVTALRQRAVLITNNIAHFEGLGLDLDDWSVP
ncbi:PIN domain-containing protein [uncultured Thiocystis sp.]|jgi:predicted nucleic acid-binding protein|uniref:PIN domain-containing protein n=1 Tax=uncultured Thiocystis sp. TaxID=1202134 RepID=UPI0025EE9448|nr:PIN domain-containing protein [uncultured Thiocystis sp.]